MDGLEMEGEGGERERDGGERGMGRRGRGERDGKEREGTRIGVQCDMLLFSKNVQWSICVGYPIHIGSCY